MKRKLKFISALSLVVILSSVGCGNKEADDNASTNNTTNTTQQQNATEDTAYVDKYYQFYGDYMTPLGTYGFYNTPDLTIEYYNENEYPGNKKYVEDLKAAYLDSKEKIQLFVNSLENELDTEDEKLNELNKNLIDYGKKTIENIDEKLKKLESLPEEAYNKGKEEFIRFVYESTKVENDMKNDFEKALDNMKDALGIDDNNNDNNNK